ncbi:MAG: hypothetical protein WBP64_21625 [Nitrososphaeraceae archaeon]
MYIVIIDSTMAIRKEYPERYDWWLSELESLGVSAKVLNDLNNIQEVSDLTENLKQSFYEEYKTTYNE